MKNRSVVIMLVAIMIGAVLAVMYGPSLMQNAGTGAGITPSPWTPTTPTAPTTPTTPSTQHPAATLQYTGENEVTGASITTVDQETFVAVNGVFSFLSANDQVGADSAPEQGTCFVADGAQVIMHVEDDANPSGGADYYDRWYAFVCSEGQPIYRISDTNLIQQSSSPYTYKWDGSGTTIGNTVHWTSGTTNYWDVGRLGIVPRTDDASLDQFLRWGGTTLASMTDGATEVDTQAEQSNDVTLTTDDEVFEYYLSIDTTNLAFGVKQYTIGATGKFEKRPAFIMISTNCTAVSVAKLQSQGWGIISLSTLYAEKAFYKEVPEMIPSNGQKATLTIEIPFDVSAAAASTAYNLNVWMNDVQLQENVAAGAPSTSIPTAYGGIAGYGIASIINDETMTASSGVGTTQTVSGDFTTAA